ncbi:outer membrane protein assembly factor BamB family protein [Actinomadura rudentiformis]|uniref:PQQ-binding-like beta-propeller repeat protein n=1 Tax=Actinomadura rudentiformis TaxID=359158 RepID=A0A6H9YVG4_9ACTN|nr:PQQ-binding-like beta-propeller repeat protein [Actinomadura rudentiformis]KAB2344003.1 PQQ-binding-like beta-propeller repeat protein [Actinomadura rudentiformis]
MASHTRQRPLSAIVPARIATAMLLLGAAGCSSGPGTSGAAAAQGWSGKGVNAVSRPVAGAGVTAVTGLRPDGTLETSVFDLPKGRSLWSRPATMVGRLSGMGVQPPAVVGPQGKGVVVSLEPQKTGKWKATLVARDARSGAQKWVRPVDSTFGPVRCGPYICMSEFTARRNARFVVLDPEAGGRQLWKMPGIAEVEWADAGKLVAFRMAKHPTLEAHDLKTGKPLWSFPVERAVGAGVNLSGGWAFGSLGDVLVGYMAPYQARKGQPLSAFGFFGLDMATGKPIWARKRLLRVYPSANPAVALITRQVTQAGGYGGFEQLDPRTGRTTGTISADKAPKSAWWLAFPADLTKLGFLSQGRAGAAYDLRNAAQTKPKGMRAWSFCTVDPAELKISGQRGFFPVAPLCAYDLAAGKKISEPGPPPGWYTGAVDGWRVWRDEAGVLHAVKDAKGTTPGMYGL